MSYLYQSFLGKIILQADIEWFQMTLYTWLPWLALIVEDKLVAQEGLRLAVGRCLGLFYANNGMVGSRYPEWTQGALNVLFSLFYPYVQVVNIAKSNAMTCHPGELWYWNSEEAVGQRCTEG